MNKKSRNRINWTRWDKHLGKTTDHELASKIGCSQAAVSLRRKKLGVPPNGERSNAIQWESWDSILGTMEDKYVAKKIGCSLASIVNRRKKLGIDPHTIRGGVEWERWDQYLPTMTDSQLAKKIGCAPGSVRVRREKLGIPKPKKDLRKKIDWEKWESKIGEVSDTDLAGMIGCSIGAIQAYRRKKGISHRSARDLGRKTERGVDWLRWDHLMGHCPDEVLARMIGVNHSKVSVRRMRMMVANYTGEWSKNAVPCLGGCGRAVEGAEHCSDQCRVRYANILEGLEVLKAS